MKVAYPVIFTDVDTNILIEVPDLGIITEANEEGKAKGTMADAIMMARDAIGINCIEAEDNGKKIIKPSEIYDIDVSKGTFYGDNPKLCTCGESGRGLWTESEKDQPDSGGNAVDENAALPNWLNQEAEKAHVNVSKVLQEALMARLGVSR